MVDIKLRKVSAVNMPLEFWGNFRMFISNAAIRMLPANIWLQTATCQFGFKISRQS
jgi:hypothetical protein